MLAVDYHSAALPLDGGRLLQQKKSECNVSLGIQGFHINVPFELALYTLSSDFIYDSSSQVNKKFLGDLVKRTYFSSSSHWIKVPKLKWLFEGSNVDKGWESLGT